MYLSEINTYSLEITRTNTKQINYIEQHILLRNGLMKYSNYLLEPSIKTEAFFN